MEKEYEGRKVGGIARLVGVAGLGLGLAGVLGVGGGCETPEGNMALGSMGAMGMASGDPKAAAWGALLGTAGQMGASRQNAIDAAREGRSNVNVYNQPQQDYQRQNNLENRNYGGDGNRQKTEEVSVELINLETGKTEIEIVCNSTSFDEYHYLRSKHQSNQFPKNGYLLIYKKNKVPWGRDIISDIKEEGGWINFYRGNEVIAKQNKK